MDIREILAHLRRGSSNRQISRNMGIDRRTVRRYRKWAHSQGLMVGEFPAIEQLQALGEKTLPDKQPPQNVSSEAPYREKVEKLLKEKVEAKAIHERFKERGFSGSYSGLPFCAAPQAEIPQRDRAGGATTWRGRTSRFWIGWQND